MDVITKLSALFTKAQKRKFALLFGLLSIGALFDLLGLSLLLPFVQAVVTPASLQDSFLARYVYYLPGVSHTDQFLHVLTVILISVYIIKNLYLVWMQQIQFRFIYNCRAEFSVKLLKFYLSKQYTFKLQKNTAELLRIVTTDVFQMFEIIFSGFHLLTALLVAALILILLLIIEPVLTSVIAALLGVCTGLYLWAIKIRLAEYGKIYQDNFTKMQQWELQAFGGIKEIKLLQKEPFFVGCYEKYGKGYTKSLCDYMIISSIPKYVFETVCVCGILTAIAVASVLGTDLSLVIPQISVATVAFIRLIPSVNAIRSQINAIQFYKPSIDLIYKDFVEGAEFYDSEMMRDGGGPDIDPFLREGRQPTEINICAVTYVYPGETLPVLRRASCKIAVGSAVGMVGANGAGKTTMADLILGILKPTEGEVLYGGVNVHQYRREWSKKLGYIPQNIYIMDDTIRNNIAFGIPEAEIADDRVWAALRDAHLKAYVENLEKKLDTVVGELGMRLSGGERQRIGIARALYHNPEILVLDEATASLDIATEAAVMDSIQCLKGEKTLIIISHRLSALRLCDALFRIENGGITAI